MIEVKGNIWALAHFMHDAVVIPTNQGYTKDGRNVMGAGIANQAKFRHPEIEAWYGDFCMKHGPETPVVAKRFNGSGGGRYLIFFPVKPLNAKQPWMSWQQPAQLSLIERSLQQLSEFLPPTGPGPNTSGKIYVPFVGCGNGGLEESLVIPLMDQYLTAEHFIRVRLPGAKRKQW
jgi:hypothetical protein